MARQAKESPARPTMFIGSSKEALPVAEAIHSLLERRGIEPTVWDQGVFGLNSSGLGSLMSACSSFRYACFVLRADDLLRSRGKDVHVVRDNVILEIGLFLGALGRERVFVLFERGNKPTLPSDLDGITFLDYDAKRADENLKAALTSPATEIANAVRTEERTRGGTKPTTAPRDRRFRVSPLDSGNTRWRNMSARMERCRKGDTVCFISITGRNFLLPHLQEGESVDSRLGPRALSRGVNLRGILLDPSGVEADFRSAIESPRVQPGHRLLMQDAQLVAKLPSEYAESYGLWPRFRNHLRLRYSAVGLSFGLWLFSDIAFVEPFHFGKRRTVPHLCGFAQLCVEKGSEEFELLKAHFEALWEHGKDVIRRR